MPQPMPSETRSDARSLQCDLLVVGSGASGLAAAVTAAWHGLEVVVVEKDAGVRRRHSVVGRMDVGAGQSARQACRHR